MKILDLSIGINLEIVQKNTWNDFLQAHDIWPIGPIHAFCWEVVMPDLTCIFCGGHAELHGR
jgi:hypothetical protein